MLVENKIKDIILKPVNNIGFDILKISFAGLGGSKILEIMIEKSNGDSATISDCQQVSKTISTIIDVEDVIQTKYLLSVSSAGVERPLITLKDFERFKNRTILLKLYKSTSVKLEKGSEKRAVIKEKKSNNPVLDDQPKVDSSKTTYQESLKNFECQITDVKDNYIQVLYKNINLDIDYANIRTANLVFTDAMFKESAKKSSEFANDIESSPNHHNIKKPNRNFNKNLRDRNDI